VSSFSTAHHHITGYSVPIRCYKQLKGRVQHCSVNHYQVPSGS